VSVSRITALGDRALLVEIDTQIDVAANERALALAGALRARPLDGVLDIVPAYASIAVHIDPARLDLRTATALVRTCLEQPAILPPAATPHALTEIPVCYDAAFGPDLTAIAARAGCSTEDAAALHAGRVYRVFMLGFLPGFAYMGAVDERIATPRHPTPRARVAAGSVGIAGSQTGIYPRESPGGWQIIGRTPVSLFDARRTPPALLAPGASVRFVPISRSAYETAVGETVP
jgi:inhibitor of KinA